MLNNTSTKKDNLDQIPSKKFFTIQRLVILVFVTQILVILFLGIASSGTISNTIQKYQNDQIISKVSKLTSIDLSQSPVIALIQDVNKLKNDNSVQADIYKDAQNGDYVIGENNKMIIYRSNENKIIYSGDTPSVRLSNLTQTYINDIILKAKAKNIILQSSTETPQVSSVLSPNDLIQQNGKFYKDVQKDDIVAFFNTSQIILLYRPNNGTIINTGKYNVNIQ